MSNIAAKPQMNTPEAMLMRAQPKISSRSDKPNAKGNAASSSGALDLSAKSSVEPKSSSVDKSADKSSFSDVLEAKSTPSRSNGSPVENKNLKVDSKIATKGEATIAGAPTQGAAQKSDLVIAPQSESETQAVSREAAMQVFLDRMQNELGVDPEQILQAFAQLDVSDLTAPPEQTLEKVIGQLNLPPAKAKQAEDMYAEMLALSATANMSEYLKNQNQTASLAVLSPKQAAQKELQKNIVAMNDSFFNKPAVQNLEGLKKAQGAQAYGKMTDKNASLVAASQGGGKDAAALAAVGAGIEAALANQDAATGFALPENVESMSLEQQKSILAGLKNELAQLDMAAAAGTENAAQAPGAEVLNKNAADTAAQTAASTGALGAMAVLGKESASNGGLGEDSRESKDQLGQDVVAQLDNKNQPVNGKAGQQFAVETPIAAKADAQNNIQDVISQAQFLAKKGGGEMKVKMSPEGMGDVHLKVIVEKGQVNVEMIASNSEAKKLLERGIDELKANLVSHKLHVDQIRVGGSNETSTQMNNQHQPDDGSRFQQKFLQDFKDQNSAFRREIFDIGPARRPGSQILEDASAAQYKSNKKRAANRRLDLVA